MTRCRRRAARRTIGVVLVQAAIWALVPAAPLPGQPTPADGVSLEWSEVTAGALTAAPFTVEIGRRDRVAVVTEDRHVRAFDETGRVIASLRTGIRAPLQPLSSEAGIVEIAQPDGRIRRFALGAGELGGAARHDGTAPDGAPIPEGNAAGWARDRLGNGWFLVPPRNAVYVSAAGRVLARVALPSRVTTLAAAADGMWVGLADGRIVLLGSGGGILDGPRLPEAVTDLLVGADARRLLISTIDAAGVARLHELHPNRRGAARERLIGRAVVPRGSRLQTIDDGGAGWIVEGGTAIAIGSAPVVVPQRLAPLAPARILAAPGTGALLVLAGDGRLLLVGPAGTGSTAATLRGEPSGAVVVAGRVAVWYADWRMEVFAFGGSSAAAGAQSTTIAVEPPVADGALAILARAVLDGARRAEREALLDSFESRLREERLGGHLTTLHEASRVLLTEVYRGAAAGATTPPPVDLPQIRLRTVALLAQILDSPSRAILTETVARDPDPRVAADAVRALARVGLDRGTALEAALRRFNTGDRRTRDLLAAGIVSLLESGAPAPTALRLSAADAVIRADVARSLRERAAAALRAATPPR